MVASGVHFGIEGDQAADGGQGGLGLGIELVGSGLVIGADALAHRDSDLIVVGGVDADRAMIIHDLKAGPGGEVLLEMVVEVEGIAEDVVDVFVVDAHVVANLAPVESVGLGGHQAADHDDDNQQNAARADAARGGAFTLGLLILDQLDHAPEDQQKRPVMREPGADAGPGQQVQVAQKENQPQDDQHERAAKRAAARPRRNRRWSGSWTSRD